MAVTEWILKLYDLSGNPVNVSDTWKITPDTTNQIRYATDRTLNVPLNGLDRLDFTLYLDDPMAQEVRRLDRVVKLWRNVNDPEYGKSYTAPAGTPDFAGLVAQTHKDGERNTMRVTCYSPLWRLQFRYHIENHYLVYDSSTLPSPSANYTGGNRDDLEFDQSALMWYLIDLVNGAYGANSFTGIKKPTTGPPYWPKTIKVSPYRVPRGSNTWAHIFENIMKKAAGCDLTPEYIHADASADLMYFKTAIKRGTDKSATCHFQYHMGDFNCQNMTEDIQITPSTGAGSGFANIVLAVGQGGPNVTWRRDESNQTRADGLGWSQIGNYMKRIDEPNMDRILSTGSDANGDGIGDNNEGLDSVARYELTRSNLPATIYTVSLSPAVPPYYKTDFDCGDVVMLSADKGALVFSNKKRRIYDVTLKISENNMETAELHLAEDFFGKVASTP